MGESQQPLRTALVSGGSRGIGRAVADALGQRGFAVALCARDERQLSATAGELAAGGRDVLGVVADFGRAEDIARAVDACIERWGQVDVLVNNAGGSPYKPFLDLSDDDWDAAITLKLMGYVRAARAVLPHMIAAGSGSIVNVVGTSALQASPGTSVPGSLCAALVHLTKGLAVEVAHAGVRVNAVSPGPTATDRLDRTIQRTADREGIGAEEAQARITAQIPLGRVASPADVARVVAFLVSDEAAYLTGTNVLVDGGLTRAV